MTNELEQEFFKVFGIEPKWKCSSPLLRIYNSPVCKGIDNCNKCAYYEYYYPEITAEKLLQMICILNETSYEILEAENTEDLKNEILETCIKVYNTPIITSDGDEYENTAIYDKIQQLFKD